MGYRENILANVRNDRRHPVWNGVKMQAHHLLSKSGVRTSGLKGDLEHLGYDINVKENLVLLPCSLKGACHLGVQLHRGNHTATAVIDIRSGEDPINDSDSVHELSYHAAVVTLLQRMRLRRNRGRLCESLRPRIQRDMDALSATLLQMIQTFMIPLTSIHTSFRLGAASGCCNSDTTGDAARQLEAPGANPVCASRRNHSGDENITHRGKPYLLSVGE